MVQVNTCVLVRGVDGLLLLDFGLFGDELLEIINVGGLEQLGLQTVLLRLVLHEALQNQEGEVVLVLPVRGLPKETDVQPLRRLLQQFGPDQLAPRQKLGFSGVRSLN